MDEIPKDYIDKAIDELISTLGIKENTDRQLLVNLVRSNSIERCIQEIARYLVLPIKVNLSYVPVGYRRNATDGFTSTGIVKTAKSGQGLHGIVAQVSIPSYLPLYGSADLVDFPIKVRVSEDCARHPDTLICVMAHELSHIVLHSIRHPQKENEIYTDLTAMLLGFSDITRIGRRVVETTDAGNSVYTHTTTYGYLSDENFAFAQTKIANALSNKQKIVRELRKKLHQTNRRIKYSELIGVRFRKYLDYIDQHHNQRFAKEDFLILSTFHHPGFLDDFLSATKASEKAHERIAHHITNFKAYTPHSMEFARQGEQQLELTDSELEKQCNSLVAGINTLRKYVSIWFDIKTRLEW
jgi:hypothetical protein